MALLTILPGLPGGDHELRPVTIDAGSVVRIRGRAEEGDQIGQTREVTLSRSTISGPAVQVVLDRRVLARALTLKCNTLKLTPDKPIALESTDCTFVAAQLDSALIVPPPTDAPEPNSTPTNPERKPPMKPESNGHIPPRGDPADPLELAEALRDALADATAKAARLVAALRQGKKEKKVLSNVLSSLKQLNLGDRS